MKKKTTIVFAVLFSSYLAAEWAVSADAGKSVGSAKSAKRNSDWAQWGGSSLRNNTPEGHNIPTEWAIGEFDYRTGAWNPQDSKNVKWVSRLGSQTYGNPVVADGKVYVGTNNSGGWLGRYPADVDLGCLLCFDLKDGKFLWQHSSEKLPTGRVHDWPLQGICCAPLVEGDRLWFVTSRGEVRCGWADAHAEGSGGGQGFLRQGAAQGCEP
jgi:hypothetical protein